MSTTYCTTIGVVDGMAWFEDGTSVQNVTVELIRAAPDLLAALESLLDATERTVLHVDAMNTRAKARQAACEAIAKAQGGQ